MRFKKMKGLAISTAIILGMTLFVGCDSETEESASETSSASEVEEQVEEPSKSPEELKSEYIESTKEYSYEDMLRNAEENLDKPAVMTGEISQVQEQDDLILLHMNITQNEYGYWEDDIFVGFAQEDKDKDPDAVSRFMEDDVVTVYGDIREPFTYKTVMNEERTVPLIRARYIKLK